MTASGTAVAVAAVRRTSVSSLSRAAGRRCAAATQVHRDASQPLARGTGEDRPGQRDVSARAAAPGPSPAQTPRRKHQLVREFIGESLYDTEEGYFAKTAAIHTLPAPLDFAGLRGQHDYEIAVAQLYADSRGEAWHTPAEVLQPHYAHAFARCILEHAAATSPPSALTQLDIVEVGGGMVAPVLLRKPRPLGVHSNAACAVVEACAAVPGNGTLMTGILDYLADTHAGLYENVHYHLVEISPAMHRRQRHAVAQSRHCSRAHLHLASMLTWAGPMAPAPSLRSPCYVVATEVLVRRDRTGTGRADPSHRRSRRAVCGMLEFRPACQDNLPHDKVVWDAEGQLWECHVATDAAGSLREEARPLSDPVLQRCLAVVGDQLREPQPTLADRARAWLARVAGPGVASAFVPTGAFQLLEQIRALPLAQPASVVLADFDQLPMSLPGRLGPTVQRRVHGTTATSDTYLVRRGTCDIMFPTDFGILATMHRHVLGSGSAVWKQPDFMRRFAVHERTRTRTGYNPLLQDYDNVSVLASWPERVGHAPSKV